MKTTHIFIALLVAFMLISCSPATTIIPTERAIPMASNFSFVFKDYLCGLVPFDVLDSASGVLVHTPLTEKESITIPFQLATTKLEEIFHKIEAMDFFNFPSNFVIPDEYMVATEAPTSTYTLSVMNGTKINSISWTTGGFTDSGYTKADQLNEFIRFIQKTIRTNPEYQKLPKPSAGCA